MFKLKLGISFLCVITTIVFSVSRSASAQTLELYVDAKTKQIFAEPGPGRTKLGTFVSVEAQAKAPPTASTTNSTVTPPVSASSNPVVTPDSAVGAVVPASAPPSLAKQWYDKLSVRGYTQFRYTSLFNKKGDADWYHPADKSVGGNESFLIRRARLVLSGDVSDHLFVYLQPEFNAAPSDGDYSTQLRDLYADVALDKAKEFRIRAGQSKVPYGFTNMQSSQNRAALERPDATDSAVEGERDLGVYLMWAPAEIRERFHYLTSSGLKGSGDYGVVAIGSYNGQGPNRADQNSELHSVVRVSYPFQFPNGQYFEPGIQAYTGRFVPKTAPISLDKNSDETVTPAYTDSTGVRDERIGFTSILYPQPFGIEAEWNIGRGPELSDDYTRIDDGYLQGGAIQGSYKIDSSNGTFFPFVRWQYYDGGRKFGKNAPEDNLNEWDFGLEWSPWKEIEFTAQYSLTNERTNTNAFPYDRISDGHRLGLQMQWNY